MARVEAVLDDLAIDRDARVLVACSGGPDSMALAHLAMALARSERLAQVVVAYIDHQLREDSANDGERVRALALAGGAAYRTQAVSVATGTGSLEGAARDARYRALEKLATVHEVGSVWLGHTARDQVETVFMRMLRGTGVAGLAGIPRRRGVFIRPLIDVGADEIAQYLRKHELTPVQDPMNRDERFFRVRVRQQWLPKLRGENPALDRALLGLAASAAEMRTSLDYAARALAERALAPGPPELRVLASQPLTAAPAPVVAHLLAQLARELGGGPLDASHIAAVVDLLAGPAAGSRQLDLPNLTVLREYDTVRLFVPDRGSEAALPEIRVAGSGGPFEVRMWQPGDRMRPERLKGRSRKLSDLFIDARVPQRLREHARVVVRLSDQEIVWAEHLGQGHGAVVDVTLTPPQAVATNR